MREIRGQFSVLFKTREGNKFWGEVGNPIERTTPIDFQPRRFISTSIDSVAKTGDVASYGTACLLLALQTTMLMTKHFKGYEITHRLSWTRDASETDLVTGLTKSGSQVIIDDALPVVMEYGKVVENMGIETDRYRVLTGADVHVGDRLGAFIVQSRRDGQGLHVLEIA